MKTRKWPYLLGAVFTVLSFSTCQDWGEMDPPAGNQTYPKLERVANINFEEADFDPASFNYYAYENGEIALVEDSEDELYGNVLHLPNGYARLFNPLNTVKVQNGISLTFMLKQAQQTDGESGDLLENDLKGALFSFQNANGTQRMFLTANGWLNYDALDGTYEANNPETECKTGMIDNDGLWHYVALKVCNDGYEVYVDGKKKVEKTETKFDFSKIVKFMAAAPYLYIGYGADEPTKEMWIDDLRLYRNQITAKEVADYRKPTSGGEEDSKTLITFGAEDNSDAFLSVTSDLYSFRKSVHMGFYNYTSEGDNWNNFAIIVSNNKKSGDADYQEYFILRADAFGWKGGVFDNNTNIDPTILNLTHNYNWDTFKKDMQGAYINLDITREKNTLQINIAITTTNGTTYTMTGSYEDENLTEELGAYLTVDHSHFKLDATDVYTESKIFTPDNNLVGPTDCSAGWWAHFSEESFIEGDNPDTFCYEFINNNTGNGSNWHNWLWVVTNGSPRGSADYKEYFVLRADAYGWQYDINTNTDPSLLNLSHSYDYNTFVSDLHGARIRIIITRSENVLNFIIKTRTAAGVNLGDLTGHFDALNTPTFGTFLTVEQASLELKKAGYFPYANMINR